MADATEDGLIDSLATRSIPDPEVSNQTTSLWVLLAILALATALRLYGLASWPLDQDELYTLRDARAFREHINYLRPVYPFLQHLLLYALPPTPLSLRLLPLAFGVLGVWLTWELGRRFFGTTAGLVAASLVAISPWHLYASQFARYWTLVYALAALLYTVLPQSVDRNRPGAYLLALSTIFVGMLTHPSFVFPLVGVLLAVFSVSKQGRFAWTEQSGRAWAWLWGPIALIGLGGFLFHVMQGTFTALGGRGGLSAPARLIPAMVQWTGPVIVAAALFAMVSQLVSRDGRYRRWGAMATAGSLSGVALLSVAALYTPVYADYGIATLPLAYVAIGGGIQRISEQMSARGSVFAVFALLTLAAGMLPGTVSHLSDGTRFNYQPSYDYIQRADSRHLVVGWPATLHRYYAPDVPFELLGGTTRQLDETLERAVGFWLVASYRRYGLVRGNEDVSIWISKHCGKILQTTRNRIDYRTYRVELHWCGGDPPIVLDTVISP